MMLRQLRRCCTQFSTPRAALTNKSRRACFISVDDCHKRRMRTTSPRGQIPLIPKQVSITQDKRSLRIHWGTTDTSSYNVAWLRHNCQCPECKQVGSGQKIMDMFSQSPSSLTVNQTHVKDGRLHISWSDHDGFISLPWLNEHCYSDKTLACKSKEATPDFTKGDIPTLDYEDILTDEGVWTWLEHLNNTGLCLIKQLPPDDTVAFLETLEKISPVLRTIYGPGATDVKAAEKDISNIAYSTCELPLHMDFPYYESIPGLQFLKCNRVDDCVVGGESVLIDLYLVAELFRQDFPEHFETLVRVPATFQKIHYDRGYPIHMIYQRPHFELNSRKQISSMVWSPPFEGPLEVPPSDVAAYYEAYYQLGKMIYESPHKITHRLQSGEMISFNNKRVLHGRNSFALNGGVRHLEVAYIHSDEFQSKVRLLAHRLGKGPIKRIFNKCNF